MGTIPTINVIIACIVCAIYAVMELRNPDCIRRRQSCDNCTHLIRKGGGYTWKYDCEKIGNFDFQPQICKFYSCKSEENDNE